MQIRQFFTSGKPSFSFEFFPPKSDEAAAQLERTIVDLSELGPTFISVTYGAGGSTREKTIDIVSRIKRETGIEAMAHLTCVGASKDEIAMVLDRLLAAGVENVLALRGDPPKGRTSFEATEGGFRYANELVAFIRERYGNSICIGAAAYPETHVECENAEADLINLKHKVDAGVDFVTTQLFFDNRHYTDFVKRARAIGITIPIVPGIMPILNAAQAERFGATLPAQLATELARRRDDHDAVLQLGVAHATAQCIDLLRSGVPGIHFYTLNRSTATRHIFTALQAIGLAHGPA